MTRHNERRKKKLPAQLIGRNLSVAQLYLKPKKRVARLLIRGDRGVLDIKLTVDELRELFENSPGDSLTFTFHLVEGMVAAMRAEFEKVTVVIPEHVEPV